MRSLRLVSSLAVAATAVGLALPATVSAAAPAVPNGLPSAAVSQIDALSAAKEARTPAQRKVSSQLLTAETQQAGGRVAAGVGRLTSTVKVAGNGTTQVSVEVVPGADTTAVAKQVAALGGTQLAIWKTSVDATVPLKAVDTIAAIATVRRVDPSGQARFEGATPTEPGVQAQVAATGGTVTPDAGSAADEGDKALAADVARATYKVGGSGVTVGVLSDGVDSLAASIASGDLPVGTHALDGQEGSGDEGTAMLEIVHDVAPTASLLFATANPTADAFAANIRALRAAGADVIVDDVLYYAESPFQDGPIAQAVRDVTADGAAYFSSAGNEGSVDAGTGGNWEGDFVSSGLAIGKFKGVAADFAPGAAVQASDPLSDGSAGTVTSLFWANPLGKATDDYDLYVIDADGVVVAASNDTQDGDDDPFEILQVPFGSDLRVAVVRYKGASRYLQVTTFGGQFADNSGLHGYATPGATRGHSAVPAAYSVAAAPAADPLPFDIVPGLANPKGPYPGSYTAKQKTEVFSSDGPRRVFFNVDGSLVTPGDTSSTGGVVRKKPDITSADGVSTSLPDFTPFFGTSAAAPHAAALAALVLSGNPGYTPAQLRAALTGSAIDIEHPGYDRDSGHGIPLATTLLAKTGATPQPRVVAAAPKLTGGGDGDQYVEPGEKVTIAVPVTNVGDGDAANVSVSLSGTGDTAVSPVIRQVGTIGQGVTKNPSFTFTVPRSHPAGTPIPVTATVRFTGVLSPTTATLSIPVGQPAPPKAFSYTGPAKSIPDGDPVGVTVPLTVKGIGTVSGVTFSLDGNDCSKASGSGIDHTWVGDLIGTLTAPDGTAVTLWTHIGGNGDNFCKTVFYDAAGASIQAQTSSAAPFTGKFRPAQPLAGFVGKAGDGTWKFNVADTSTADTGHVRAFTLKVAGYVS